MPNRPFRPLPVWGRLLLALTAGSGLGLIAIGFSRYGTEMVEAHLRAWGF